MKKSCLFTFILTSLLVSYPPLIATSLKDTYSEHNTQSDTSSELVTYFIDHPDRILWKGWTVISRAEIGWDEAYCMVTDDDKLFLFSHRPSAQSLNPAVTIDLSKYGFVGSKEDDSSTFMLSSINPYVEKPTSSNTLIFQLAFTRADKKHIDPSKFRRKTLQDLLFDHLKRQKIDTITLQKFKQWLKDNEIYEDAIKQDIEQPEQSNLQYHFPAICKEVQNFVKKHPEEKLSYPSVSKSAINYQSLFSTLRYATHQYHYFDRIDLNNACIAQTVQNNTFKNILLTFYSQSTQKSSINRLTCTKRFQKGYTDEIGQIIYQYIGNSALQRLQKDTLLNTRYQLIRLTCFVERAEESSQKKVIYDDLLEYLALYGVAQAELLRFKQWFDNNQFDEEMIVHDMVPEGQSNLKAYNEKIYQIVEKFIRERNLSTLSDTLSVQPPARRKSHMYCFFPHTYSTTYHELRKLLEHYLDTDVQSVIRAGGDMSDLKGSIQSFDLAHEDDRALIIKFAPDRHPIQSPSSNAASLKKKPDKKQKKGTTCVHLRSSLQSKAPQCYASQCPIYATLYENDPVVHKREEALPKGIFIKKSLLHLQKYEHGTLPDCPHQVKCPVFQEITHHKVSLQKLPLVDRFHMHLFTHPDERRRRRKAGQRMGKNQFTYQSDFAQMHPLDLRAIHPLDQLQDPRRALKALVQEVIEKGPDNKPPLADGVKPSDLPSLQYITSSELPWIATVEKKLHGIDPNELGASLNIVDVFALKLYTDWTDLCYELGKAQRSGDFKKFPIWDQCLMRAILKLHYEELAYGLKPTQKLYSGLHDVQLTKTRIGFFKTYTSTTLNWSKANEFMNGKGMIIYLQPEMCQKFVNCSVRWLSAFTHEEEILFARSADIGVHPSPKWKGEITGYLLDEKKQENKACQIVTFTSGYPPLIVRKGKTHTLKNPFHKFSYIKLEEDATLSVEPWKPDHQQGGYLQITCFGACILEKNAKIDLSAKGFWGGTRTHPQGYGEGGGYGGNYCAAGGSYASLGGAGQCKNAFSSKKYDAPYTTCYGALILDKGKTPLGSGGGYIWYSTREGARGSRGGGALDLRIHGNLQMGENARFLADGADADDLSGGAGSGGSLYIEIHGSLILSKNRANLSDSPNLATAWGGDNEFACDPIAQGHGGAGKIVLYLTEDAQIDKKVADRLHTAPHALILLKKDKALARTYVDILHYWLRTAHPSARMPLMHHGAIFIVHYLIHYTPFPYKSNPKAWPKMIPSHASVSATYYMAQGAAYDKQGKYDKAIEFYQEALEMYKKVYGSQPHPDVASSLHNLGAAYADQGKIEKAMEFYQEALEMRKKVYGNQAHPDVARSLHNLGIAYYRQGKYEKAMEFYQEALEMEKKVYGNQAHPDVAVILNSLGVAYDEQGKIERAIEFYQEALEMRKKVYGNQAHPDVASSLYNLGIAYDKQGKYEKAMEFYQEALEMRKKVYGNQAHPHVAGILYNLGAAYADQGKYDKAIEFYQEALEIYKKVYGNQAHPSVAMSLHSLGNAYYGQGKSERAMEFLQEALEMRKKVYGNQAHPDVADSLHSLGVAYKKQGKIEKAMEFLQEALEMRKKVYGNQAHPRVAYSLNSLGIAYADQGKYDKAIEFYQEALEMHKKVYGNQAHPDVARSLDSLGNAYKKQGKIERAIEFYQEALEIYKKVYGNQVHPDVADSLNSLGGAYKKQGKIEKAIEFYQEALEMRKKVYGNQAHPDVARSLHNLGIAYYGQGKYEKAMEFYQEALEMEKKVYGNQAHPDVAVILNSLGVAYDEQGKIERAIEFYQEALEMRKKVYGNQAHPDVASSLYNLGIAYDKQGKYEKAMEFYQEALEMRKKVYGNQAHPSVAGILNNLGAAYTNQGKSDKAIEFFQEALEMEKKVYGNQAHPDVAGSLNNLGIAYYGQGKYERAIEFFQEAFEMKKKVYGNQAHPDVASSLHNLGAAYDEQGKYEKAIEFYQEALEMRKKVYGNQAHPDVASSLHNLGAAYDEQGKNEKAIEFYQEALEMRKKVYGNNHPKTKSVKKDLDRAREEASVQ